MSDAFQTWTRQARQQRPLASLHACHTVLYVHVFSTAGVGERHELLFLFAHEIAIHQVESTPKREHGQTFQNILIDCVRPSQVEAMVELFAFVLERRPVMPRPVIQDVSGLDDGPIRDADGRTSP